MNSIPEHWIVIILSQPEQIEQRYVFERRQDVLESIYATWASSQVVLAAGQAHISVLTPSGTPLLRAHLQRQQDLFARPTHF